MKISNYIALFLIFCIPFVLVTDVSMNTYRHVVTTYHTYNTILDDAVADTLESIVENDYGIGTPLNKFHVINSFYDSLFAAFNITDNLSKQATMKIYIPVISLLETDGVSILYNTTAIKEGVSSVVQVWTDKYRFSYEHEGGTIFFSTNNNVEVLLPGKLEIYSGDASELDVKYASDAEFVEYYNSSLLQYAKIYPEVFEDTRQAVIADRVDTLMSYYVNENNRIAHMYGIKYRFNFPQSALDNFTRPITDTSLFVLFQGYPIGGGSSKTFNKAAFGGARAYKFIDYVVDTADDGFVYYHKHNCALIKDNSELYPSAKKAAESGAYACEVCKP